MDTDSRRKHILSIITGQNSPVSASALAKTLNVSRQVVVGDIALLRAQGHEVIATARGYLIPKFKESNRYIGKIVCRHTPENTVFELYAMVDAGAFVINVIVEHELYGEITGNLNLSNRDDVDAFIEKVESSEIKLLSELTSGIHLHTVACRDNKHFEQVCKTLEEKGFIIK
ncbi:MAG: transcription repressor NadR [Defluviitaleaceae bacterium]|nr:transcription repressor NadR [Defluviitaleaceae bacterium]MCL2837107.1 transcription repressor NadR [Defluviitaleaceae bacterium]